MKPEEMQKAYERLAEIHAEALVQNAAHETRMRVVNDMLQEERQARMDLLEDCEGLRDQLNDLYDRHMELRRRMDRMSKSWWLMLCHQVKTILKTRSFK